MFQRAQQYQPLHHNNNNHFIIISNRIADVSIFLYFYSFIYFQSDQQLIHSIRISIIRPWTWQRQPRIHFSLNVHQCNNSNNGIRCHRRQFLLLQWWIHLMWVNVFGVNWKVYFRVQQLPVHEQIGIHFGVEDDRICELTLPTTTTTIPLRLIRVVVPYWHYNDSAATRLNVL